MDSALLIRYLRGGGSPTIKSPAAAAFSSSSSSSSSPSITKSPGTRGTGSGNGSGSGSSFGGRIRQSLSPLENVMSLSPSGRNLVGDDVVVLDGVLVPSPSSSGRARVSKSINLTNSSLTGYKTELCKPWEILGHCRHGSNCQFAHGKEDLRPTPFPLKGRAENCKPYSGRLLQVSPRSPMRYNSQARKEAAVPAFGKASPTGPEYPSKSPAMKSPSVSIKPSHSCNTSPSFASQHSGRNLSTITSECSSKSPTTSSEYGDSKTPSATFSSCWSPQDDGIEVTLPSQTNKSPSREDVDACIHSVLFRPIARKRLPIFCEICPGQ